MTRSCPPTGRPRTEVDLVLRQLAAVDAWHASRRAREEQATASPPTSREARLELERRRDVVRRQLAALVERAEQDLRTSAHLLRASLPLRAVVAHRDPWFASRVCEGLAGERVQVLCWLDDGADAVGATVAEQPDLLLVGDRLPGLPGAEVLREALPLAEGVRAVAQASDDGSARELRAAGALAVLPGDAPPPDVVACLLVLSDRV